MKEVDLDLAALEKLGQLQCTQPEIAAFFGVCLRTIERKMQEDKYRNAYDKGKGNGLTSLRRAQFRAAVEDGNPTMLVWMGKQLLNQKDRSETESKQYTYTMAPMTPEEVQAIDKALRDEY